MYLRMQGFHSTVEDFREAGVLPDFQMWNPFALQQARRASGRDKLDAHLVQTTSKRHDPRFI